MHSGFALTYYSDSSLSPIRFSIRWARGVYPRWPEQRRVSSFRPGRSLRERREGRRTIVVTMRRFVSFAAVLVMLLMTSPALACVAGGALRHADRTCCEAMHGRCGEMVKEGCCQVEARSDLSQLPAETVSAPVAPQATLAIVYATLTDLPSSQAYRWRVADQHPPPGLLLATTTVLRI